MSFYPLLILTVSVTKFSPSVSLHSDNNITSKYLCTFRCSLEAEFESIKCKKLKNQLPNTALLGHCNYLVVH